MNIYGFEKNNWLIVWFIYIFIKNILEIILHNNATHTLYMQFDGMHGENGVKKSIFWNCTSFILYSYIKADLWMHRVKLLSYKWAFCVVKSDLAGKKQNLIRLKENSNDNRLAWDNDNKWFKINMY